MTALAKDNLSYQAGSAEEVLTSLRGFPVDASKKLYAGGIVGISTSGFAGPADGTTYTQVVGVCDKQVDNSSGSAGAANVQVRRGVFGHLAQTGTTIDKTKIGQKVYAVDDNTLSLSLTGNAFAGYVDQVLDGVVFYSIGVLP